VTKLFGPLLLFIEVPLLFYTIVEDPKHTISMGQTAAAMRHQSVKKGGTHRPGPWWGGAVGAYPAKRESGRLVDCAKSALSFSPKL
jgi:hypothetical protein